MYSVHLYEPERLEELPISLATTFRGETNRERIRGKEGVEEKSL
jgi:hypothetical protein